MNGRISLRLHNILLDSILLDSILLDSQALCAALGVLLFAVVVRGNDPYANFPQVQKINEQFTSTWEEYQIQPSSEATDGEWCRRVFLDVIGRIPKVEELNEYLQDDSADKKLKLVNKLLYNDTYTEEYARNWTTIWTNVLIGRTGGTDRRRDLSNREGMQKYLRDTFARNKPYDRMVHDLVTATGATTPGSEGFNGAVNFLANKVNNEMGTLATSATSRTFLGLQVQCTQCHNHPFNEWKQGKFWEFNAFFRQTRTLRRFVDGTRDVEYAELVNEDFRGEAGNPFDAQIFFEKRNLELVSAYPVFVDDTSLADIYPDKGNSGYVKDVVRRTELGKFIVESEYMEKVLVNRMWAHFLGYGFTKPIDDLGPHNPPSQPVLLDYLGAEFRKNSFDLKQLNQWILLSKPYSLSSRVTDSNKSDDPLLGESPKFSHFYLRQLEAEQLYESLLTATAADKTRGSYEDQERAKTTWLRQFVTAFGTDEGEESTTFNGTIPQVLMMFNGDLIRQATGTNRGSMLWQVATDAEMNPREKISHLFLTGLSRRPSRGERTMADNLLRARAAERRNNRNEAVAAALQDVWWAVLNSNEFIFNH